VDNIFIDNLLEVQLPLADNTGVNGYTVTEAGPIGVVGQLVHVPAARVDQVFGYTLASGVIVDSTKSTIGQARYTAAATDVQVNCPANTGSQKWRLVFNDSGADIEQGFPVKKDIAPAGTTVPAGGYAVVVANGSDPGDTVVGVTQFQIPNGYFGYVLVEGSGWVEVVASLAAGSRLAADAATAIAAGATETAFGVSDLVRAASDGLVQCSIKCSA